MTVTERNPTVVVTADETLPDVLDRLREAASGGHTVDLVVPIDGALLLTASEFRALKDAIDEQRLAVVLRTADPLRLRLGERLGLRVQALPRPRPLPGEPIPAPLPPPPFVSEPPEEEDAALAKDRLAFGRPDPAAHWPSQNGDADLTGEPAADEADESAALTELEPANPPRRWLPAAALLVLIVAAAFLAIRFVVPRAVVRIVPMSAPVAAALVFDVTADGEPLDADAAFALAPTTRQLEVVFEGSVPASGVRVVPDGTAGGPVELRNASGEPLTVDAGTIVTTESGVEFSFAEAVTVPAADAATGEPGAATGSLQAVAAGSGGNVEVGEIGGRLPNGVYYSNRMEPTAGGADKEFPVVTQADLDALVAQAREAVEDLADDAIDRENPEVPVFVTGVTILEQSDVFDRQPDDEAESVTLRSTMTVEAAMVDESAAASEFEPALAALLSAAAPVGYVVAPDDISVAGPSEVRSDEEGTRLEVSATADARAQLDEDERAVLAESLAGASAEEAEEILARTPEIASYTVDYAPSWLPEQMPNNPGRIELELAR